MPRVLDVTSTVPRGESVYRAESGANRGGIRPGSERRKFM